MLTVLFVAAMLLAGSVVCEWLWRRDAAAAHAPDPPGGFERATATGVVGLALWVAVCWLLSPARAVARGPLLAVAAIAALAAVVLRRRMRRVPAGRVAGRVASPVEVLAVLPLVLWVGFVLWRGRLLPVLDFDALSYHMPRAVLAMRAGGYHRFDLPDMRSAYPVDYELLLASSLALEGSDVVTAWITTLVFVLFLCASAALFERWWGRGRHVLAGMLTVASVPVLLLHSGAHKNDLLANLFFLTGPLWAARWAAAGGEAPLLLAVVSVALAFGTKVHGALVGVGIVPALVYGTLRGRLGWRRLASVAAVGIAALLLLGGVQYAVNLRRTGTLTGLPAGLGWYGDWSNLWMFPALVLSVPFSSRPDHVWVPWRGEWWPWRDWDLYTSHFGAPFTPLLLLVPVGVWWGLRRARSDGRGPERVLGSVAVALSVVLMLPVRLLGPLGMFCFFPRFLIYAVPVVVGWTVVPFVRSLAAAGARRTTATLVVATSVLFTVHAVCAALFDGAQPWPYVWKEATVSRPRSVPYMGNRACSVLDRLAGPDDHVAVHGDTDMCVYLAYGAELRRRVTFIGNGSGPVQIPDDARWVLIDRPLNRMWGHPGFTDMGKFEQLQSRGTPTPEDRKVLDVVRRDPHFHLVYKNFQQDQALFLRVAPADAPPPATTRMDDPHAAGR